MARLMCRFGLHGWLYSKKYDACRECRWCHIEHYRYRDNTTGKIFWSPDPP